MNLIEFAEEFNSISWKSRFATRHLRHLAMLLNNFRKSRNIISVFCFFALPSISQWRYMIWKENSSQSRTFIRRILNCGKCFCNQVSFKQSFRTSNIRISYYTLLLSKFIQSRRANFGIYMETVRKSLW